MNYLDVRDQVADLGYWSPGSDEGDVADPVNALGIWEGDYDEKLVVYHHMSDPVDNQGYIVRLYDEDVSEFYEENSQNALARIISLTSQIDPDMPESEMSWNQTAEALDE